ncbi:hypothetical protein BOX24_01465 [Leptospirillum ferriphilum]|uniref:Uncharacterized protein n=2 Tax=Nitrospiraceae TaxID=189779 RepID=A0A1V3SXP4_9BACT|nr:hypothetical protein BOX24_01465 [Leptospirillum ferriphilum]
MYERGLQNMADDEEVDPLDEIELPLIIPKRDGPDCPFCGDPMMSVDGDYVCLDCNGTWYGPNIG